MNLNYYIAVICPSASVIISPADKTGDPARKLEW